MASDDRIHSLEVTIKEALANQESTIKSLRADLKEIRRALTLLAAMEIRAHYERPFSEVMDAVVGYVLDGKRPNVTGWGFH